MLDDKPANARSADTKTLWQSNKDRALATISRLRLPQPRPLIAARDPNAFRILAVLALVMGFVIAGPHAGERLQRGLFPPAMESGEKAADDISFWITPPDYTGLKPLVIEGGYLKKTVPIPAGSIVKIRVGHGCAGPSRNW